MVSFLTSHRLRKLSRSIISCTFEPEERTKDSYKEACRALYQDMLQYREEYPRTSYRDIYWRFVDEEIDQALRERSRQHCFLSIAVACILLTAIGIIALKFVLTSFSEKIPISYL